MAGRLQTPTKIVANLTSAGTQQQATTSTARVRSALVQGAKNNTGNIYIAFADEAVTSANGLSLAPGEAYTIEGDDGGVFSLDSIWFDGDTTNDDLIIAYMAG